MNVRTLVIIWFASLCTLAVSTAFIVMSKSEDYQFAMLVLFASVITFGTLMVSTALLMQRADEIDCDHPV